MDDGDDNSISVIVSDPGVMIRRDTELRLDKSVLEIRHYPESRLDKSVLEIRQYLGF